MIKHHSNREQTLVEKKTTRSDSFLGRILLVPSLFSRLSSIFSRLQSPVLLVLSFENGRFGRLSEPSAS